MTNQPHKNIRKVIIADILKPHALGGALKIRAFTDDPQRFLNYKAFYIDSCLYDVESIRVNNAFFILKLKGIDDIDSAESLRGLKLSVRRDQIPDGGKCLIEDFIGLEVYEKNSGLYRGKITGYYEAGNGGVLGLEKDGKEVLIPYGGSLLGDPQRDIGRVSIDDPHGHYSVL